MATTPFEGNSMEQVSRAYACGVCATSKILKSSQRNGQTIHPLAGNENLRPGRGNAPDGVHRNTPVGLNLVAPPVALAIARRGLDFFERLLAELLAAESRIDAHREHEVGVA